MRIPWAKVDRAIEPMLALAVAAGLAYAIYHLFTERFLPQPFFYDAADTWMDWFNISYWGRDAGTYDAWGSVYTPVPFLFLDLVGFGQCYPSAEGYAARECDWLGIVTIHVLYLVNIFLLAKTYLKANRATALPRAIAVSCSLSMLHSVERGNVITLCFACFVLAHGPLLKSARAKWIAAAVSINFKLYLFTAVVPYLLKRRWLWVEAALLCAIAMYVVGLAILGRGLPSEIFENIVYFSSNSRVTALQDLWFGATYQGVVTLIVDSDYPIASLIGSNNTDVALLVARTLPAVTQASIVIAAMAAWLRPEAVPSYRLANFGCSLALVTIESGGYVHMFTVFLALLEPWRGFGRKWAIVCAYIVSIPADIFIYPLPPVLRPGWLNGAPIFASYWMTVGPFVRPGLFMMIPLSLAMVTLHDVGIDVWRQRWRQRWRFRRDAPLLLGASPRYDRA